jgi:hypothetical protein
MISLMAPLSYTITAADVGKYAIRAFGRTWATAFMGGPIREADIGRRLYLDTEGGLDPELPHERAARALIATRRGMSADCE